jgi:hypothetical protein
VALFQLEISSNEEMEFERVRFRELGCGCSKESCYPWLQYCKDLRWVYFLPAPSCLVETSIFSVIFRKSKLGHLVAGYPWSTFWQLYNLFHQISVIFMQSSTNLVSKSLHQNIGNCSYNLENW